MRGTRSSGVCESRDLGSLSPVELVLVDSRVDRVERCGDVRRDEDVKSVRH